jgi:hypothetical protein
MHSVGGCGDPPPKVLHANDICQGKTFTLVYFYVVDAIYLDFVLLLYSYMIVAHACDANTAYTQVRTLM